MHLKIRFTLDMLLIYAEMKREVDAEVAKAKRIKDLQNVGDSESEQEHGAQVLASSHLISK